MVLDHGLGVASLYGHLASFDVGEGDDVEKGQVLGRSGATGLAGGDHLHFAILVGDTYVEPDGVVGPEVGARARRGSLRPAP